MKRLILAGIVGRHPFGGVTWCALQYIAGFQRLGYEVFYVEDNGECGFDPIVNGISKDPSYAVRYIGQQLRRVGLEESWSYVDYRGTYHGRSHEDVVRACQEADVMVNLSGGCWFDRPEYQTLPRIFIDTDPGFTQQAIVEAGEGWYRDFFAAHDTLFTFALNIDDPSCTIASTPFQWHPTVQPVELDFWSVSPPAGDAPYSTVMSWSSGGFPGMGKGKGRDLLRMLDLPERTGERILLAIAGQPPSQLLDRHGWEMTDAVHATIDPDRYRDFIAGSKAELGFAKAMYVDTRSGWFSDRTQCYLASGRPALVRDTAFSNELPTGEGLLTFGDVDGILDGMQRIGADYERHRRRAREIAEEHFAAPKVLSRLLETAGVA